MSRITVDVRDCGGSVDRILARYGVMLSGLVEGELAALEHALGDDLDDPSVMVALEARKAKLIAWRAAAVEETRDFLLAMRPA